MPTAATANAPASGPRTPCLADEVTGGVRADPGCEGERDEGEAGGERAPAEHVLEVERAEQEEAEDRAGGGEHQDEAAADGAVGDPLDAEERLVDVQLVERERGEPGEAADPAEVRLDRRPAGESRLRDPVDDRGEARRRERRAAEVEAAPARLLRVGRDDLQRGDASAAATGRLT